MIDSQIFYHSTIRKTVVAFGQLFNNIKIQRRNPDGTIAQTLKVPLSYGPKQKWLTRIRQNPDLQTRSRIELTVPRLGFEIVNLVYDPARKVPATKQMKHVLENQQTLNTQYVPAPWNIFFSLHAFVKNQDDGLQILEQILPFFSPEYVVTVNDIPEMNLKHELPIILTNASYDDAYEGDFTERTSIVWTLDFVAKMNIYGPVYQQGAIKKVIATVYPNMPGMTDVAEQYTAQVDPESAGPQDDFTILEEWDEINV